MQQYLPIAQIAVAVILVALILLQQRGTALGSSFGQEGGFYATRRGVQQKMFIATIVSAILFLALALLDLAI
jgi:protein translocase SecG subunit